MIKSPAQLEEQRILRSATEMNRNNTSGSPGGSSGSFEEEEYARRYDAYRPKFKGIPEGYYPNTWGNIILIWVLIGCLYIFSGGLFAFLLWLLFLDTTAVSWIYAGIGGVYVAVVIGLIFIGQTMKNKLEKQAMEEALKKQREQEKEYFSAKQGTAI